MLHSATINVMVKAARHAGRSLKRDLGEVENLQVSLKGPANFVTMADRRAEEMLYSDLTPPGRGERRLGALPTWWRQGRSFGAGPFARGLLRLGAIRGA